MITAVIKSNSVILTYESLSSDGKLQNKRQAFNLIAYEATNEDTYAVGNAIGDMLAYNPKEILKSTTTLLMEV